MRTELEVALNLLDHTPSERLPQLMTSINNRLSSLTAEQFDRLGDKLVTYGDKLMALINFTTDTNKRNQYEIRFKNSYRDYKVIRTNSLLFGANVSLLLSKLVSC